MQAVFLLPKEGFPMTASTAYVTCTTGGKKHTWHFTGVTAVEHSLSLNLDSTSAKGKDVVNGARNRPDRVTLSVVETDAAHGTGWSARMLEALAALKRERILCRVVTSMGTYKRMLLGEITVTQDGENQCGWQGTLVFCEYAAPSGSSSKEKKNNSSTRTNTGTAGGAKKISSSPFQQLLQRAGIG